MQVFLVFFLCGWACFFEAYAQPLNVSVHAEAAILMNADTGAILYEKNAHQVMYPASVTKIATALVALKAKNQHLNDWVTIEQEALVTATTEAKKRSNWTLPAYWLGSDSMHMGLKSGEAMTLADLLYGMLVVSANDAANSIAIHVGGSIPRFMELVNAQLKELGCRNTHFCNPSGIFHPQHQTTAYDLALMTKEALQDPVFCKMVSTVQYPRPKTNKQPEGYTLLQTNMLLRKGKAFYPKAIGVKTGYTSQAGHTYVSAATNEGRTLIAVLLKNKERADMFSDATKLFETAFKQPRVERTLLRMGPQNFVLQLDGASRPIAVKLAQDLKYAYYPAEEPQMKCLVYWDEVHLPVAKEAKVGEVRVTRGDGAILASAPLLSVELVKGSWTHSLANFFQDLWAHHSALVIVLGMAFLFGLWTFFRR